jgi:hypothetical protein
MATSAASEQTVIMTTLSRQSPLSAIGSAHDLLGGLLALLLLGGLLLLVLVTSVLGKRTGQDLKKLLIGDLLVSLEEVQVWSWWGAKTGETVLGDGYMEISIASTSL